MVYGSGLLKAGTLFFIDGLVNHVHFCGDHLLTQVHYSLLWSCETGIFSLWSWSCETDMFCGDDLLKHVLFIIMVLLNRYIFVCDVFWNRYIFLYDGLVKQVHFMVNGLVKQICILLMVMWSMYCSWQWSSETGTFLLWCMVFWNRYIFFMWWSCETGTFLWWWPCW